MRQIAEVRSFNKCCVNVISDLIICELLGQKPCVRGGNQLADLLTSISREPLFDARVQVDGLELGRVSTA